MARFYSRTFHVPLTEVGDLPPEDVVLAYYEECFEGMTEGERAEQWDLLTESPEEREAREKREAEGEALDDEFYEKLNQEVAAGTRGPPRERRVKMPQTAMTALEQRRGVLRAIKSGALGGEAAAPEPDIHVSFGGNLEGVGDQDPLAPPPEKD